MSDTLPASEVPLIPAWSGELPLLPASELDRHDRCQDLSSPTCPAQRSAKPSRKCGGLFPARGCCHACHGLQLSVRHSWKSNVAWQICFGNYSPDPLGMSARVLLDALNAALNRCVKPCWFTVLLLREDLRAKLLGLLGDLRGVVELSTWVEVVRGLAETSDRGPRGLFRTN